LLSGESAVADKRLNVVVRSARECSEGMLWFAERTITFRRKAGLQLGDLTIDHRLADLARRKGKIFAVVIDRYAAAFFDFTL